MYLNSSVIYILYNTIPNTHSSSLTLLNHAAETAEHWVRVSGGVAVVPCSKGGGLDFVHEDNGFRSIFNTI